jgi:hypothetical protein
MVKTLRTLLIALALASPVFAGMPWAGESAAEPAIHTADSRPLEGSRQDDAGTLAEQAEEEDGEEEESRDLHPGDPAFTGPLAGDSRYLFMAASGRRELSSLAHLPLSRGPPARR